MGLKDWKCSDTPRKTLVERQTTVKRPCIWKSSEIVIPDRKKPDPKVMKLLEDFARNYEPTYDKCPKKKQEAIPEKPRRTLVERQADYRKTLNETVNRGKQPPREKQPMEKQPKEKQPAEKQPKEKVPAKQRPCVERKLKMTQFEREVRKILEDDDEPNEQEQKRLDAYAGLLDIPWEILSLNWGPDQFGRRLRMMPESERRPFLMRWALAQWYEQWQKVDPEFLQGFTLERLYRDFSPCDQAKPQCRYACPNVILDKNQTIMLKYHLDGYYDWTPNRDGEIHTDFFETVWGKGLEGYEKEDTEGIDYCVDNFPINFPYEMENALAEFLDNKLGFHKDKIGIRL